MAEVRKREIVAVLFDGFELLDVFGPLEVFGVTAQFDITLLGPAQGPVLSAQGPSVVADRSYHEASPPDTVLVPGGIGTRRLVTDAPFTTFCAVGRPTHQSWPRCAPALDGYAATSNKRAFSWAREQGAAVDWRPQARWVRDRNRWTSSGVAAGIDMALALLAELSGDDVASAVADGIEYEWHRNAAWDPFAAKNGLLA